MLQHLPQVREGDVLSLTVGVGRNAQWCMRILAAEQDPVGLRELPGASPACRVVQAKYKVGLGGLVQPRGDLFPRRAQVVQADAGKIMCQMGLPAAPLPPGRRTHLG